MAGIAATGVLGWRGAQLEKRWGRCPRLRLRRLLLLLGVICFSPVLLPLVCLSFPVISVLALCFRLGGDRRGGGFVGRGEEGAAQGEEGRLLLLHRYLEDQMGLVGSVVWDCYGVVDDDEGEDDDAGEEC